MKKINIGMISLGCDKNRVDAEIMLGILSDKEYNIVNDEKKADVIIINTCGFIESAKQESIDTILELAQNKVDGRCKALIATGCLAERYSDDLLSEIPELDAVVGVGSYMEIDSVIKSVLDEQKRLKKTGNIDYDVDFSASRVLTTPNYTAYIKIAEGCNNNCSYCIIPKIRGIYRSRSMDVILKEAYKLAKKGVKEIILVAQDTSKYGIYLYGKKSLPMLLKEISKIEGIEWIRVLYCYPEDIDDELIKEIKENEKVCNYIDIPMQHINDEILNRMGRFSTKKAILNLIKKLRENIPDVIIRTSLIVGFPGETDEQFMEMYDFLKEYEIDRVGVFMYSKEEGTSASLFEDQIDEKIKRERQKRIMLLQKRISSQKNKQKIGNVYKVLVEGKNDAGIYFGRTYGDAPDIDGIVYIKSERNITAGKFINVKITRALNYDLVGVVWDEPCE